MPTSTDKTAIGTKSHATHEYLIAPATLNMYVSPTVLATANAIKGKNSDTQKSTSAIIFIFLSFFSRSIIFDNLTCARAIKDVKVAPFAFYIYILAYSKKNFNTKRKKVARAHHFNFR
jgi:hypothetical protein